MRILVIGGTGFIGPYLVRQLENFQHGVRGTHRQDYYGWQMATMADSLKDERSINDVVAYINTLDPRTN